MTSGIRGSLSGGLLCLGLLALAFTSSLGAHPYHVTVAEAALNRETGMLEVSLRVLPEDLEKALGRRADRRVHLEEERVDDLILGYLRKTVIVRRGGEARPIRWVGKELSVREAWLYFEISLPEGLAGAEIRQGMFFELEERQVNTLNLRDGDFRATLTFHRKNPVERIP